MLFAAAVGLAVGTAYPAHGLVTKSLIGWNVGVWLYLLLIATTMVRADHARLRQAVAAHSEGAFAVSVVIIAAALASLAAIVLELSAAKVAHSAGQSHALRPILMTLVTVIGSWLMIPVLFMLNYATLYYSDSQGTGLRFPPDADAEPRPIYADFAYFSFTIAVAMQTADVVITTTRMRELVLAHAILSFVFNTAILALMVNIAASLF